ncbi:MAG: type II toxin-antitoxin system RelE/ParE family toxin [Coriobacteriia bacterium]|nr:type II toxin-antitoxin system RelE/ParE family toxin [Coriobacteriia bacterium]MCL2536671.1 type II toxin-antitoxin system RelE/ParE family toxin [Coriobacteriia bacterium]
MTQHYHVVFSKRADKALSKMDHQVRARILRWIRKNLAETADPRLQGKSLTGKQAGAWRYRIGNYRVIANIKDNEVTIYIIDIGHRGKIYE